MGLSVIVYRNRKAYIDLLKFKYTSLCTLQICKAQANILFYLFVIKDPDSEFEICGLRLKYSVLEQMFKAKSTHTFFSGVHVL